MYGKGSSSMHIQCLKTEEANFSFCVQSLLTKASSAGDLLVEPSDLESGCVGFAEPQVVQLNCPQGKAGNTSEGNGAGRLARGERAQTV